MNPTRSSSLRFFRVISIVVIAGLGVACSPPVQRPTGPARDYEDAKDLFKRGNFDRALEYTDGLASSSPPTAHTERARVLRAMIFIGRIKAYKELSEAYTKGSDKTKNPHFKGVFGQQRHDNLQFGARSALGLAETAHQFLQGGATKEGSAHPPVGKEAPSSQVQGSSLPREVTLELPFPTAEGPVEVKDLARVSEGGWIEPEQQEAAAVDSLRKGIDDALAEAVNGDRSQARSALSAGPVKIDGVDFGLLLVKELLEGAIFYDSKHIHDPQRLRIVCKEADDVAMAAVALLTEKPNKDKEAKIKKVQDQIKTTVKKL